VIGVPTSLALPTPDRPGALTGLAEPLLAAVLVSIPVFLQAPWVRTAPFSACLFTAVLLALGIGLERRPASHGIGQMLVGFSGSWLAGSVFWGWCRLHPLCHLPVEAFALPLALAGLGSRWRLAAGFYLASLLGTAATDAAIAGCGLMPFWTQVLASPPGMATDLLQQAAAQVLTPLPLLVVGGATLLLVPTCRWLWRSGPVGRVCGAALATTLAVDGLFLATALLAPGLSGLVGAAPA
jgi:hypothetical protein